MAIAKASVYLHPVSVMYHDAPLQSEPSLAGQEIVPPTPIGIRRLRGLLQLGASELGGLPAGTNTILSIARTTPLAHMAQAMQSR
jgi:hypothetical protein